MPVASLLLFLSVAIVFRENNQKVGLTNGYYQIYLLRSFMREAESCEILFDREVGPIIEYRSSTAPRTLYKD